MPESRRRKKRPTAKPGNPKAFPSNEKPRSKAEPQSKAEAHPRGLWAAVKGLIGRPKTT
jgi:hypothetical protein